VLLFTDTDTSLKYHHAISNSASYLPLPSPALNENPAIWGNSRVPTKELRCGHNLLTVFFNNVVKVGEEIRHIKKKLNENLNFRLDHHLLGLVSDMTTYIDLLR